MKRRYISFKRISIRAKMTLSVFLAISLLLGTITVLMYENTKRTIEEQALHSFEENVQKTSAILDTRLSVIKEATEKLNLESRLYDLFLNLDSSDSLELLRASKEVTSILRDYIPWYSDIYSAHLVTSYYRFGSDTENYYPDFMNSRIAREAWAAQGKCVWFPTYSYTQMYGITNLEDSQIPYGSLFSVARLLNLSDASSGRVVRLSSYTENPVLVVNFQPDYLEDVLVKYSTNDSLEDTEYYVIQPTRRNCLQHRPVGADWRHLSGPVAGFSGKGKLLRRILYSENGEKYLLSYCASSITDWLTVMKIRYPV